MVNKRDALIKLTKDFFSIEKRGITQKDLEKFKIYFKEIQKLFGSLRNLLEECGISTKSRMPNMTDNELRNYIKNIFYEDSSCCPSYKVAETVCYLNCNCWITDKLSVKEGTKRPQTFYKNKKMSLARLSYLLFNGPLDPKLFILHKCDNERCFQPLHLYQGTAKQNSNDIITRKRNSEHPKKRKFIQHKLKDPYDYPELLTLIKERIIISPKNEWLYTGTLDIGGYAILGINKKAYRLHRLILANKLGVKYEEINLACHKFSLESKFSEDTPQRHDVNPDHLYNGDNFENVIDTISYRKNCKLSMEDVKFIRDEAEKIDFTKINPVDFDFEMGRKLDVSSKTIRDARVGETYKFFPGTINKRPSKKPIIQLDLTGKFICEYESATDAAKLLGFSNSSGISNTCTGILKHFRGYIWKFKEKI